jgi:hypothetical protein
MKNKSNNIVLFSQVTKQGDNNPEYYQETLKEIKDGILSFVWNDEYSNDKRQLAWVYAVESKNHKLVYKAREIPDVLDLDRQYNMYDYNCARPVFEKELSALRKDTREERWNGFNVKIAALISLILLGGLSVWHFIAEVFNMHNALYGDPAKVNEGLTVIGMVGIGLLFIICIVIVVQTGPDNGGDW